MSGTLYVVATPIGNLEDITLRALRVLREATVIASEDTRRTSKLLSHHGIHTPTLSFHEHNSGRRLPELMGRLSAGDVVALVSDAGTPLISDPGLELVQACVQAEVPIEPIPGASAPLTALIASGFPPQPVTILGFAPSRANNRTDFLSAVNSIDHTVVFFETPHRVAELLSEAAEILVNRPLCVARELTKLHQEILRGTASTLAQRLTQPRGEFTIVVAPRDEAAVGPPELPAPEHLILEFRQLTDSDGLSRREAVSALSRRYKRPSREVYTVLESAKDSSP
jgi:16S rRNA (cytidine1402-2'-O)-methyltransferase